MKYKVTLKVSYLTTAFLFDDRQDALDFMETAWMHRDARGNIAGMDVISESPKLSFTEEEA